MEEKPPITNERILFLCPRPNLGGASQVLLNLLNASRDLRWFEAVFVFDETGPLLLEYSQHGSVFIFPLEKKAVIRKMGRRLALPTYDYLRYLYVQWIIRTQKPRYLYLNSLTLKPTSKAAPASTIPLILHAHVMDTLVVSSFPESWARNAFRRTSQLIACAKAVADSYERTFGFPPHRTAVVYGPVSAERLFGEVARSSPAVRSDNGVIVMGVVANLSYLKAPDLLIEAFLIVRNQYQLGKKNILKWLGAPAHADPYFQSIEQLVNRHGLAGEISFLPASEQTAAFYASIDIFVLPSRMEGFPLTILEAMLFGKPMVAMDVGGVREVVNSETGMLRKSVLNRHGIRYEKAYSYAEDYALWIRTGQVSTLTSLPAMLLRYRWHSQNVSQSITRQDDARGGSRLLWYELLLKKQPSTTRRDYLTGSSRKRSAFQAGKSLIQEVLASPFFQRLDKDYYARLAYTEWESRVIDCLGMSGLLRCLFHPTVRKYSQATASGLLAHYLKQWGISLKRQTKK